MGSDRTRKGRAKRTVVRLPAFPSDVLADVNLMERSTSAFDVASAALHHHALTRRPVPNYHLALNAEQYADVVLAALYRRGMIE
jgi:hypothetical protein